MQEVKLVAPLTRGRRDHAPGETLPLPPSLAGKLVDRGRAVLQRTGGIAPALAAPLVAPPVAPGGDE